jgi:outer membrane murein-binding lipoprotein Lpp
MSRGSNYPEGGAPASSQIIWLEKRVKELEEKLDEISKDRDDWAKKYQALSLASNKTKNEIDFAHAKETQERYTHMEYGCYKLVTHGDGTITVTKVKEEK